jgi:hypothetical protein
MGFSTKLLVMTMILSWLPLSVSADEWYEGGTLYKATVAEWNKAAYSNKLATASDWATTRPQIVSKVQRSGTMETLRPFAEELVKCIDEAASGKGYSNEEITSLAAGCMILMGW